jgi:hypothetical protein
MQSLSSRGGNNDCYHDTERSIVSMGRGDEAVI